MLDETFQDDGRRWSVRMIRTWSFLDRGIHGRHDTIAQRNNILHLHGAIAWNCASPPAPLCNRDCGRVVKC
jgi:hypothetical protein